MNEVMSIYFVLFVGLKVSFFFEGRGRGVVWDIVIMTERSLLGTELSVFVFC